MPKLTLSISAYNELATVLEQNGFNIKDGTPLIIEKGTQFQSPVDFRIATMRRDCANIASQAWEFVEQENFIEFVDEVYQYVLNGKVEVKPEPFVEGVSNKQQGWT